MFAPNPNRNMDNTLKEQLGDGNPRQGEKIFFNQGIDLQFAKCNDCHETYERGAGTNRKVTPRNLLINPNQSIDVPQIRNQYEKSGFSRERLDNSMGFGHNHDGTLDGLVNFFHIPNFTGFAEGEKGEQERRDVIAYVMSFSTDTHAGVGTQVTLTGANNDNPALRERLDSMLALADRGDVGLIVKTRIDGRARGFEYVGNRLFAPDRVADALSELNGLLATAGPGRELTFTLVPLGTQRRMGVDRNADGFATATSNARDEAVGEAKLCFAMLRCLTGASAPRLIRALRFSIIRDGIDSESQGFHDPRAGRPDGRSEHASLYG